MADMHEPAVPQADAAMSDDAPPVPPGFCPERVEAHIVAKPADIDELLCAAVLSVFRSCKHNE